MTITGGCPQKQKHGATFLLLQNSPLITTSKVLSFVILFVNFSPIITTGHVVLLGLPTFYLNGNAQLHLHCLDQIVV